MYVDVYQWYTWTYVHMYVHVHRDTFNGDTNHHWLLLLVDP